MRVSRAWAMPSKDTFSIEPIAALVVRHMHGPRWVDPFCGLSPFKEACIATNDLNPDIDATHHIESLEFLSQFGDGELDGVFFDPPYSPRQISEVYKSVGHDVQTEDTQSAFWGDRKKEIARIVKPGGIVISCGWNSNGIGYSNFFQHIEVLIVAHGGWHNDTIVTVEKKVSLW